MQKRIIQAGLQGMNQDVINPNVNSKQAYEIKNFRLNATANSNAIELTTEKGMKTIGVVDIYFNKFGDRFFDGYEVIGHCSVQDYLVLFLKGNNKTDRIMTFMYTREDNVSNYVFQEQKKGSFVGNLNFNGKIEAIPCYESEDVIKIYWIDGENYPRVINIMHDYGYQDEQTQTQSYDPFSFYQEISSGGYNTIDVAKTYVGGLFYAGVVQYSFSFYNRNSQETPVIHTTSLNYISHEDRGEAPNKQLGCAFTVTVKINPEDKDKFDYIRVYSIYRSSVNGTPVVKVIKDIKCSSLTQYPSTGTVLYYQTDFVDTNEYGYDFDAYKILVYNEYIKPNAMTYKDQKLFLGNYKSDFDNIPYDTFIEDDAIAWTDSKEIDLEGQSSGGYYKYRNQNTNDSDAVKIFKQHEYYKFGLQFQDIYGKWTQPFYITTLLNDEDIVDVSGYDNKKRFPIPVYQYTIQALRNKLGSHKDNYVKVRPVVSFPTKSERSVLCQGILNPTVFNVGQHRNNTCTAQASWFFRPFNAQTDYDTDNPSVLRYAESRHFHPCGQRVNNFGTFVGELQNMYFDYSEDYDPNYVGFTGSRPILNYDQISQDSHKYDSFYYVNYNCVTINSPEIQFDEFVRNVDLSQYKLRLQGAIYFKSIASQYNIIAESPLFINDQYVLNQNYYIRSDTSAYGFYRRDFEYYDDNDRANKFCNGRLLQTCSCWFDDVSNIYTYNGNVYGWNWQHDQIAYAVYPWQRRNLNNFGCTDDISFDSDYGTTNDLESSRIIKKILSNSRQCYNDYSTVDCCDITGVTSIKVFDYDQNQLLNIGENQNYYGNVDQLVTCTSEYRDYKYDSATYISETQGETGHVAYLKIEFDKNEVHDGYPILINRPRYTTGWVDESNPGWRYSSIEKPYVSPQEPGYTLLNLDYPYTLIGNEKVAQDYQNGVDIKYCPTPYASTTDPIMLRYKSTPHIVCAISDDGINQFNVTGVTTGTSYCYLVDVYKDISDSPYVNDNDHNALMQRIWLPCGKSYDLNTSSTTERIKWTEGDTYFMRYDCLKTYPFSEDDYQSVVEIASFPVETHINLDGRYDKNRGLVDNTFISPVNFNLINPVYSQENNFFQYNMLDEDSYHNTKFPTRFTWSLNKINGQEIDEWTRTNTAAFYDCDGDKGPITSIRRFNNQIYAFQDRGISRIKYNENVAISAQNGTPIELANSQTVNGVDYISETVGSQNKWSNISTPNGIFFVDNYTPGIYRLGGGESVLSNLTKNCMQRWFESRNNSQDKFISDAWYDSTMNEVMFMFTDDDSYKKSIAFNCDYNVFSSFYDYKGRVGNIRNHAFNLYDNDIYFLREGNTYNTFYRQAPSKYWISFVANAYVDGYSPSNAIYDNVWYKADVLHYYDDKDTFNYGELIPETDDKIYDFTKTTGWYETFNKIVVGNDYQYAENKDQTKGFDFIKKFRTWRVPVPRQTRENGLVGRERMRNSWLRVRLENTSPSYDKMVLRDIYVDSFY